MKILILGDLHGFLLQKPKFEYDAVICTGDLCDDRFIRPFIQEGLRQECSWSELVTRDEKKQLIKQTISSGQRISKQLSNLGKPVYLIRGNWDIVMHKTYEQTYLGKKKNLHNCEFSYHELDDCCIVGYDGSASPELPFDKQKWNSLSEQKQKRLLRTFTKKYTKFEKIYKKALKIGKPLILLSHNQPNRTKLDKVTNKPATIINKHLGSIVIRRIIDQFQPKLCIAGHIHENKGFSQLRKTKCLNAGSRASAFVLDTQKWKIISKRIIMQR